MIKASCAAHLGPDRQNGGQIGHRTERKLLSMNCDCQSSIATTTHGAFPLLREDTFEHINLMAKLAVEEIDQGLKERNAG